MGIFSMILQIAFMILGVEPIQKFPPALSREDEAKYFELHKKGDSNARDKLIEHNLRLVAHVVRKYYVTNKNTDDLISVGTIGLIKAVDSYNDSNGTRFATYAAKCIQNEILMLFRSQKKLGCEVSLNDTIDIDKDGNPLTYLDIISTEDTIADDIDKKIKINKALGYIRDNLDDREKTILVMRYGIGNTQAYTQREVAQRLGISRSYVSRIEKSSLEKINKYLTIEG
ncbi:MAG: RNA polymerase sporulation sigma factor SigK [Clostridia bacterium]|nr:RNA polymerase sporulation sigma factor SigK [Clostridia bacterium]MBQ7788063.1 RNA polymerase sporulation sigma factor SigK [Clostridia bacterium]